MTSWHPIIVACILVIVLALAPSESKIDGAIVSSAITLGADGFDEATDIAADNAGNLYVIGAFEKTIESDSGLTENPQTTQWQRVAYIASYDEANIWRWIQTIDTQSVGRRNWYVAVSPDLSVFVCGIISSECTESMDVFIAKLDTEGNMQWSASYSTPGLDLPLGISADEQSNVYIAGTTSNSPPGVFPYSMGFALKYSSEGQQEWNMSIGEEGFGADANGIAADGSGGCYVCGSFSGFIAFEVNGQSEEYRGPNQWTRQPFILKVNRNGKIQWVTNWSGSKRTVCDYIVVNNRSDIAVTGSFSGRMTYMRNDIQEDIASQADDNLDVFIIGLSGDGDIQWMTSWGTEGLDGPNALSVNDEGSILLLIETMGTDEEPGLWSTIATLNSLGEINESYTFEGGSCTGLAIEPDGSLALSGYFMTPFDFDIGPSVDKREPNGISDAFIMRIDQQI